MQVVGSFHKNKDYITLCLSAGMSVGMSAAGMSVAMSKSVSRYARRCQ